MKQIELLKLMTIEAVMECQDPDLLDLVDKILVSCASDN